MKINIQGHIISSIRNSSTQTRAHGTRTTALFTVLLCTLISPFANAVRPITPESCPCFTAGIIDAGMQMVGPQTFGESATVNCLDDETQTGVQIRTPPGDTSYDYELNALVEFTVAPHCAISQDGEFVGSGRFFSPLPLTEGEILGCQNEVKASFAWQRFCAN